LKLAKVQKCAQVSEMSEITHSKNWRGHSVVVASKSDGCYDLVVHGNGKTKADAIANAAKAIDSLVAQMPAIKTEIQNL
jgi:hypothetical protein